MNCLFVSLFTIFLTIMPLMPQSPYSSPSIQSVNGIILAVNTDSIDILSVNDRNKAVTLKITSETYIIDAVIGKPISLNERIDDKIVGYYRTVKPSENKAAALILNIPEDYSPPVYTRAVQVSHNGGQLYVLAEQGVIVSISGDTIIESFFSRNIPSIDDITGNTDLLLWNQAYNMSIPARTAANKVIILGRN